MKSVVYTAEALALLMKYRSVAPRLRAKMDRYASTGAGDVKSLAGTLEKRLRDGDFRIVFEEGETEIFVTRLGPRGSVYEVTK
jgi:mRNA interferase RelE/StbE